MKTGLFCCDIYNYSPPYSSMYRALCARRASEAVIHFKGERKALMAPYWRAFLRPSTAATARRSTERFIARSWLYSHVPHELVITVLRSLWSGLRRMADVEKNDL